MPRYRVKETRTTCETYLIDAENEADARAGTGTIIDTRDEDSMLLSADYIEQVADDEDCA